MRRFALSLLLPLLVACPDTSSQSADGGFVDGPPGDGGFIDAGFPDENVFGDMFHPSPIDPKGPGIVDPIDVVSCREPQRLSVDHIRKSVPFVLAGARWDLGIPPAPNFDILELLSRTLGEADYITVTSDNRDPNPLFMKFMDNMASKVCINALLYDAGAAEADRVLRRHADPWENLRFLRLRMHTIYVSPTSTEGLEDLHQLYLDLAPLDPFPQLNDPELFQWYGVCVAMMTAPEFFAY
jgi:hypothetical protein